MPERAYADIVGNFRRGAAGAYARRGDYEGAAGWVADDPALMASYGELGDRARTREREEEMRGARRSYAQALQGGDYSGAGAIAAKVGDVEGMTGARTAQREVDQETRNQLSRGASQGLAEMEAIEANGGQGYEEWIERGHAALAQNPDMDPGLRSLIESAPPTFNPRFVGALRAYATRVRDAALSPEQAAQFELTGRQRDTQERQADIAERRATAAETTAAAAMLRAERGGAGGNQDFNRANSLRDEYNQQTSGYRTIADFAARSEAYLQRVAQNPRAASGQGDVGLVYALAKIYDPTSVVREGEFSMVARQGGYGEQMRSWVTQALGGGFSPGIRNQIMTEIRNGAIAQGAQRDQTRQRYEDLSGRAGIDPALVIDDYNSAPTGTGGGLPPVNQRVVGQVYPMPDGRRATWNGPGRGFSPVEE